MTSPPSSFENLRMMRRFQRLLRMREKKRENSCLSLCSEVYFPSPKPERLENFQQKYETVFLLEQEPL